MKIIAKIKNEILDAIKWSSEESHSRFDKLEEKVNQLMEYSQLLGIELTDGENHVQLNTIYSFCLNEFNRRNAVAIESTEIYRYYHALHTLTKPHRVTGGGELIRVGRSHDGGYIMHSPFSNNPIAYSIGISDDVSWDKEMARRGYQIWQYDHTIEQLPEENEAFHWKKRGLTGEQETESLIHLENAIRENGHADESGMVLKLDIEGSEWKVLEQCSQATINQFDQIIMELHGLNELGNSLQILQALERLTYNHKVIHIHGNNHCPICFCGDLMTPDAVELTLIKNDIVTLGADNVQYLKLIDETNRPNSHDVWIGSW